MEIFASMLRLLPANSAERIRTLAKFVEKDYEKITKLIKFRRDYVARLSLVEQQNDAEKAVTSADDRETAELEWLSRRIDAGLFTLQTIDTVLAWLVAEDTGASRKVKQVLAERDEKVSAIGRTLKEQLDALDTTEENQDLRDMLSTLVEFVQ